MIAAFRSKSSLLFWTLGGVFLAVQLWNASTHGLSVDEAHYALYAYLPDWSYFDHPPLVGWIQFPAIWSGGNDFALRCAPIACWLLAAFLARRLARQIFAGPEAEVKANLTAAIALTVPMFHLLGNSLHPDTLLLPLTCLVMSQTWRLRDPAQLGRLAPWLGLGAALGLAGLAKYTALFLALSAAGVLGAAHGRRLLSRRGPWLAAGLALVLISPVFFWNAAHDWISFRFQFAHAVGGAGWQAAEVRRIGWEEIKTYGPLTTLALALGLIWLWREPAVRFCAAFALPPAAVILLLAGRGGSLTYWTAFAWIAALPIAGAGLARGWRSAGPRWGLGVFAAVQLLFCVIVFARIYDGGPPERSGFAANPFADLYGWDRVAARARELALEHGLRSISVMNWTLASRVAWYSRPFFVYVLDRRFDQIDMWFGKLPKGSSTILLQWSRLPYPLPLRSTTGHGFARCRLLEEIPVAHFDKILSHFDLYLCEDWDGEPIAAPMPGKWISAF